MIVSRRRRGVSVLSGGRDHLTHRARRYLPSARAVALSLGALQAAMSALAVLASRGEASLIVICASLYLFAAAGAIVVLDSQQVEEYGIPLGARGPGIPALSKRAFACLVRARPRRRPQPVLLRLLRRLHMGADRPRRRDHLRDRRRDPSRATGRPGGARARRAARARARGRSLRRRGRNRSRTRS